MKSNKRGAISEQQAVLYLLREGVDVFTNCQHTGPEDMITFNPETGETKCWEVKTENYRLTGPKKGTAIGRSRRDTRFTKIIHMLYVHKNGNVREGTRRK